MRGGFNNLEGGAGLSDTSITGVEAAFEMLLEEVEGVVSDVNKSGSQAFAQGDLSKVSELHEQAKTLTDFRTRLSSMRTEWEALYATQADEVKKEVSRRDLGRLEAGVRTREEQYVVPILTAVEEMGGSAKMGLVLDRVHELMKNELRPIDEETLSSDPDTPRWRNAGQWARLTMVHEGLLKSDLPRGTWEITDKGRNHLKQRN